MNMLSRPWNRFVRRLVLVGVVAELWAPVRVVRGQSGTRETNPVVPASLAGITTDTGSFTVGHQDFSRYTTPLSCVAAATWASQAARSDTTVISILDTLQDVAADTIGVGAVRRVARVCGARFTLENTGAKYLPALFQLAWAAQNDSLASAVFTRIVQTLPPPARIPQAITTLDVLFGSGVLVRNIGDGALPLLHALPSLDHPVVQGVIRFLDQQGSLITRVKVNERLREYAIVRQDTAGVRRYAAQLLAVARQLPPGILVDTAHWPRRWQPVWKTYHDLLRNAFYHAPDSLRVIAQLAQQDLGVWQSYRPAGNGTFRKDTVIDFRTMPMESVINTLWPGHVRWDETARKPLPSLHADVWFGPMHTPIANTETNPVPPIRGQVTFIMVGTVTTNNRFGAQQTTLVRQMLAQYGTRGFGVTVMTRTRGWLDYGDYDRALEPVTPAAEAEQIRSYYQDYVKLPVTVGVQVHHYTKRPPPDGRIVQVDEVHPVPPVCDTEDAWSNGTMCAVLVARDGTVLWNGDMLATDAGSGEDGGALLGTQSEFHEILAKAITEAPPSPSGKR